MIIKEGKKFACFSCIRGHRASSCGHVERELREIRRKGRPVTQCVKCRELRKTRKAHVKCLCNEMKDDALSTIPLQSAPADSHASKYRRLDEDDEGAMRKVSNTVAMQQSRPQPRQIHPTAVHNPATANRPVTLPARNIHGLRLTHQPSVNAYNRLPSIRSYKEPSTTIPAIGGSPTHKYGGTSRLHNYDVRHGSIMERPKCGCGCDCDEKVALLVQKIEERLGLPVKHKDLASAHIDGESASEWVERILSPVVSAMHPPSLPSFPSLPPASTAIPAIAARPMTSTHTMHLPRLAPMNMAPNGNRGRVGTITIPPVRKISGTYSEPQSARNRSFSTGSSNSSRASLEAMSPIQQQQQQQHRSPQGTARQTPRPGFAAGVVPPMVPPSFAACNSNGGGCCSASANKPSTSSQQKQKQQEPSSCCSTAAILPQQVLPVRSCCDPPPQPRIVVPESRQMLQQQSPVLRRVFSGQSVLTTSVAASPIRSQGPPKPDALQQHQPPPTATVPMKRATSIQSLSTPTTATVDKPGRSDSDGCGNCGDKCSCCNKNRKWQPRSQQNPLVDADGALECSCGCSKPFQECSDCVTDLCEGLLLKEAPL
ncbi:copper-binding transcription factor [Coemansia sp. IMI 209127]|nr:copper-binding transcription factor [Coemansia sp. IMI 209127]